MANTRTEKGGSPKQPVLLCASQHEWEQWLDANHDTAGSVWLKLAKKGADSETVSYAQALESALCYGWIDGQKAALDESFWLQRFTPRRPQSSWSQVNRDKAEELIARKRMQPSGLREVQAAKVDGRWEAAYAGQRSATVPPDLQRALDDNVPAKDFFATLDRANQYAILYRVQTAKKPDTRARRIATFVAMLEQHKKIHS